MKKLKHIIAILLALSFAFLILVILDEAEKKAHLENERHDASVGNSLKTATVIQVTPISSHALIQSYAEVKPRWKTSLKARQRGEVLTISAQLHAGKSIKKGEVLLVFDQSNYQSRIAEAKNQIAQAELLISEHKEQARIARQDWKILQKKGIPSAFDLKKPQIKAAQAQLKLAQANFNEIRKTASYSKLVAPYNGVVVSRSVNHGDVVEAGQVLAEIISKDELDISLMLNEQQWQLLDKNWKKQKVDVHATNGSGEHWRAMIERDGGKIDSTTRLRILHLKLNSSQKPLAGSFVRVDIQGKKLSNLLEIPQSALTPDGKVWFVGEGNKLMSFQTEALFSKGQKLFIKVPTLPLKNKNKAYSIVVSPLSSFLPGIEVRPIKQDQM